jgi:hypothetical protein
VREQELRQQAAALAAKEAELKRVAALDGRALRLEEERLRGIETLYMNRLREADAALDALEAARQGVCVCVSEDIVGVYVCECVSVVCV